MRKLRLAVAIFAIAVVALMYSCSKENVVTPTSGKSNENARIISRIKKFKSDVNTPSSLKSGEMISTDSAEWLVEALVNFEYCRTMPKEEYKGNTYFSDSTVFDFPVTNGFVSLTQTIGAYNQVKNYVLAYLQSLNYSWKHIDAAILELRDNKIVCRISGTYLKLGLKSAMTELRDPNLNYDWRAICRVGRCDGSMYGILSADNIIGNDVNLRLPKINEDGFFVGVYSGASYKAYTCPWDYLYHKWTYTNPCVTTSEMYLWANKGLTLTNLYCNTIMPQGKHLVNAAWGGDFLSDPSFPTGVYYWEHYVIFYIGEWIPIDPQS